jgi:hypothetical protein
MTVASRYLGTSGHGRCGEEPWTDIKLWCPETIRGGETSAHSVAKPPAGGRGGLHPFWPLLPVGVRHRGVARGSVRRIEVNGKVVSIGHHYAFPPC